MSDFVISLFNIVRLRIRCKKLDDNSYLTLFERSLHVRLQKTTLIKDNPDNFTPNGEDNLDN